MVEKNLATDARIFFEAQMNIFPNCTERMPAFLFNQCNSDVHIKKILIRESVAKKNNTPNTSKKISVAKLLGTKKARNGRFALFKTNLT